MMTLLLNCAAPNMPDKIRVADVVIEKLIDYGIDHFFILVGGNAMYLHDAINKSGVPYTAFHHEQAATMAAEAYARVNGKLACVVVTSGPAAANVVTGVAGAFYDSSPILVLCGNSKVSDSRSNEMPIGVRQVGTFELPIHRVCQPIAKFSALMETPKDVLTLLESAVNACLEGRPGPSVLNIPLDVQGELVERQGLSTVKSSYDANTTKVNLHQFNYLLRELHRASRPAVLVGHGVRVCHLTNDLLDLLIKLNLPVFTTQLGKDFIPYDHDLFIGHVGIRGDRPGNVGIHNADFLLCIGTSLHQQNIGYEPKLFAPNALKFVIELDGSVSGKRLPIDARYIDCSIESFLEVFKDICSDYRNSNESWNEELRTLKSKYAVYNEPHDFSTSSINLYQFVDQLSKTLKGGEVVITDAGLCFYVMGQAFKLKHDQRYIVSGGLGSMGYALPAAIGASIAGVQQTVAVTGDGSMQMNVQELATLGPMMSNTKIFVINNGGYASLRNTQRSFFGTNYIGSSESSGLTMPNWRLISAAYGIEYACISNVKDLDASLLSVLNNSHTQLIEVLCQHEQVVMPGVGNYRDQFGDLRSDSLSNMQPRIAEPPSSTSFVLN